ncbi:hypothetical protein D1872_265210 [compost metagenome]
MRSKQSIGDRHEHSGDFQKEFSGFQVTLFFRAVAIAVYCGTGTVRIPLVRIWGRVAGACTGIAGCGAGTFSGCAKTSVAHRDTLLLPFQVALYLFLLSGRSRGGRTLFGSDRCRGDRPLYDCDRQKDSKTPLSRLPAGG